MAEVTQEIADLIEQAHITARQYELQLARYNAAKAAHQRADKAMDEAWTAQSKARWALIRAVVGDEPSSIHDTEPFFPEAAWSSVR